MSAPTGERCGRTLVGAEVERGVCGRCRASKCKACGGRGAIHGHSAVRGVETETDADCGYCEGTGYDFSYQMSRMNSKYAAKIDSPSVVLAGCIRKLEQRIDALEKEVDRLMGRPS